MPLNHSPSTPGARRGRRLIGTAVLALGLLGTSACGMDVQTNKPYTPAEGVNVDVSTSGNANDVVHVRNLGIISRTTGEGFLSGTLVGSSADALTGVSGKAIKLDGSDGSALAAEIAGPVEVGDETLVVLTNVSPLIELQGPDLAAGLEAVLDLQFRNGGKASIRVPVLDGNEPQYRSITAAPTPSTTSSATPSPSPSE